jgi:anti-anti-sigma factor
MNDAIISKVTGRMAGSVAVIEAPASFDVCTAGRVRELAIWLQGDGVTGIVVDLAATTYLENTALGVIAATRKRLCPVGGRVAVAAAARPVTRLFQTVGLIQIVPMFATCQEAVIFLQARARREMTEAPA